MGTSSQFGARYPGEVTNALVSINVQLPKVTKNRGVISLTRILR